MASERILIMGAAGRDFHNFNVVYRENDGVEVVGFTATQIPDIAGRRYPHQLAGRRYPKGLPIWDESLLKAKIAEHSVDTVVFSYSDVSHVHVMNVASRAMAAGADFKLLSPQSTMLKSELPVIAVTAARTGSGKSQTARKAAELLAFADRRVGIVRHPMPYGDLTKQIARRYFTDEELSDCTIEEREEYEHHIAQGRPVYAGIDYAEVLKLASRDVDIILWDGGNNDCPFFRPDLWLCVLDPHRAGHETTYHPGEINFRMADVIVINKVDTASREQVAALYDTIRKNNPSAVVIEAASPITVEDPDALMGKRALVIEDGPTLTHGGMAFGAGIIAAAKFGATVVPPGAAAVGSVKAVMEKYPNSRDILPAVGYGEAMIKDLETTINNCDVDVVISATPINLSRLVKTNVPLVNVSYELDEVGQPTLSDVLTPFTG